MVQLFFVFGAFGTFTTCCTGNAHLRPGPSRDNANMEHSFDRDFGLVCVIVSFKATVRHYKPNQNPGRCPRRLGCLWCNFSLFSAHSARLQPVLPGMLKSLRIRVVIANIGQYWPRLRRLWFPLVPSVATGSPEGQHWGNIPLFWHIRQGYNLFYQEC